MDYELLAKRVVLEYVKSRLDKSDPPMHPTFGMDEVRTVWFSKTLQNWKGCFITTLPDNLYYELTYNGDADELYIDEYLKVVNKKIPAFSSLALVAEAN